MMLVMMIMCILAEMDEKVTLEVLLAPERREAHATHRVEFLGSMDDHVSQELTGFRVVERAQMTLVWPLHVRRLVRHSMHEQVGRRLEREVAILALGGAFVATTTTVAVAAVAGVTNTRNCCSC